MLTWDTYEVVKMTWPIGWTFWSGIHGLWVSIREQGLWHNSNTNVQRSSSLESKKYSTIEIEMSHQIPVFISSDHLNWNSNTTYKMEVRDTLRPLCPSLRPSGRPCLPNSGTKRVKWHILPGYEQTRLT